MRLRTRLTERLAIKHPVLSAPMGMVAGGRLAAAVTRTGGFGMIGGGYGDASWLEQEFAAAGDARVGCGFITWSLARKPELLDLTLARNPVAVMLSFGAPEPFAAKIRDSGALLICQVQSLAAARRAVEARADILVAQGGEAGGHSGNRATFPLVPEIADLLARVSPDTLLVAAGGVADGRGVAAALMLGADGVLIGTRLVASREAAAPSGFKAVLTAADGDATTKTRVVDIARGYDWPDEFAVRALRNNFVDKWQGREDELAETSTNAVERERYWDAYRAGDAANSGVLIGEAAGLIPDIRPAAEIIEAMVAEACRRLGDGFHQISA